jgi:hypothetical protein
VTEASPGGRPLEATFVPDGDPPTRDQGMVSVYGCGNTSWPLGPGLRSNGLSTVGCGTFAQAAAAARTSSTKRRSVLRIRALILFGAD